MTCRVCSSRSIKNHEAKVIHKYDIAYYECGVCGFFQTDDPCWIEAAYQKPINVSDTGNQPGIWILQEKVRPCGFFLFEGNAGSLGVADGHGIFPRPMKAIGLDVSWLDTYGKNLFARGTEYHAG